MKHTKINKQVKLIKIVISVIDKYMNKIITTPL